MKSTIAVAIGILLVAITVVSAPAAAPARPPNIVLIVADDLGYADVLFNPHHPKEVTTPQLDALAKQSVICRQGYVSGHVCSPTRTGLMTGRYQQRLGLYTAGEAGSSVPMKERLFPQFLQPRNSPFHEAIRPVLHPANRPSRCHHTGQPRCATQHCHPPGR